MFVICALFVKQIHEFVRHKYLPQNNDVFEQRKEDKYDTGAHPNVQCRDVTNSWGTLPKTEDMYSICI